MAHPIALHIPHCHEFTEWDFTTHFLLEETSTENITAPAPYIYSCLDCADNKPHIGEIREYDCEEE